MPPRRNLIIAKAKRNGLALEEVIKYIQQELVFSRQVYGLVQYGLLGCQGIGTHQESDQG